MPFDNWTKNSVRLINDEIKTWLDSHSVNTKENADVPQSNMSKKGKSRSRNSKLSDEQVQVVAARAALEAEAANLRQQQEIYKELLKLTQAKTQLEMNTKLEVLKAKEEDCQIDKSVFWTDSTIVLGYIMSKKYFGHLLLIESH